MIILHCTNTAELKKLLINLIFELDDKAIDKLLLNAQKKTFKEVKRKNKEESISYQGVSFV